MIRGKLRHESNRAVKPQDAMDVGKKRTPSGGHRREIWQFFALERTTLLPVNGLQANRFLPDFHE